jgi:hypothetical protein
MAECSPDGRWLAFEYHESSTPLAPRIGIVRRNRGIASWHPLLEDKEVDYLGDFSWSPDSRWLAAIEQDRSNSDFGDFHSDLQVVKVSVDTGRMIKLTHLPPGSAIGAGTAWLRSGLIIFPGSLPDGGIYGVPANGGDVQKLVNLPTQKCGEDADTLAASPDGQRIAFWIAPGVGKEKDACQALWVADPGTGTVREVRTTGLYPVTPFWLNADAILFATMAEDETPLGIYQISLPSGAVTPVVTGLYMSPFVCDSGRTLYFAWVPKLSDKEYVLDDFHIGNFFYGFHIWRVPLGNLLRQHKSDQ